MVAPKYGPTGASSPSETSQGSASRSSEKRREQVLQRLIEQAGESRSEGNSLFKHQSYAEAEIKYSKAIHTLQKIPGELAGPDLVKSLNNRSRVYVKLDKMELAEADASEVLSMNSVENTATSAAHLVRYHARIGLGAREDALRDLKNSADLGNADAKRLLLSQARKKKAGDGNAALTKTTTSSNNNGGATVSRPSAGGCGGANSSVRGAAATSTCAAAATAGAAGAAGAGAAAAAAGRRVRGAAGAAAARTGGGGNPVRLEARLEARAGAELTFGGTSEDSRRSWLPTEAGSGGGGDGIDKSGGAGGTSSGGSSCGGDSSAEDGVVTARVETPRRRRPRPWPGGSPGSGNPGMGKNGTAAEREEESDTYPAPLPALGGPAVRRCYGPDGGSEVDAADVASTLEAGDAAGDGDACIGAQGEDADKGDGSDKQGGDAQTVAAVPEAGAGVGFEIGEAPPPEAQAQLIRWLVAQEKEKKDCEGNIWAVLDKKWWQRWQLYTGCDEHAHAVGEARSGAAQPTADADADQATADPDAEAAATAAAAAAAGPDPDGTLAEGTGAGPAADLDSSPVEEEEAPPRGGTATVTEENGDGGGLQATAAGEDENTEEVGGDANIVPHPASAGSGAAMGDGDGGEGPVEKDGEAGTNGHQKTAAPQRVEPPAAHPGPIDNSELVLDAGTPGTIPGTGRRLRLRLVRGYHFVLVPQEAWIALHAWYGGGPALPRALVPIRDSDSGRVVFEPQLFPEFSRLDPVLRSATVCSSSVVGDNDAPSNEDLANDKPTANGDPISNGPIANGSPVEKSPLVAAAAAAAAADSKEDTGGSVDGKGVGNGVGGESTEPPPAPTEEAPPAPPAAVAEGAQDGGDDGSSTGGGVQVDRAGGRGEGKGDGSADKKTKKNEDAWYPCAACGAPSNKKCTSCSKTQHRVSYCSPACQKAHWRFHKKFCGGKGSGAGLSLAKRGKAGLDNLGNTCFLNSAVQCLSHVQPLTRHVLSNAFQEDLNLTNPLGTGGRLVQAYEQVLKELWFGSGSSVSPSGLKSAIAKFAPQFNGYSQQDSQEVLSFLLDGLHEDLNRVLKKPYLTLPDGECGRPDSIIAAESWEMFGMRDKSVLVESLYGQFKSTLECQQCGKLSRKFDEFNVMPVELLDGQRLQVILDFAPLLNPSAAPTAAKAAAGDDGKGVGNLSAAMLLGGPGVEGRKPRRVAVLVPKESLVADVKAELAVMFDIGVDEMVIVVSPVSGQPFLRILPDSAQILPFTQGGYEITAHECVPGQRHALVVNRVFDGGRHVSSPEGPRAINPLPQWAQEVSALSRLRGNDRDAPFLLSFPEDVSCLG
ncbi:conserved unknown protein [Ectocarpus siliculosus]|uniref:ubiquitinyl hydrolase 1 n=1 Tax=Ectocarpus siliculosus TaxID=2880 RepID=D7FSH2_ECTSI|nr:conserved unknown protein [Ectocarpus siliculosus]|eukprot:CBJ31113.1 conserved unknown protein [Ectocarpus siliculosus]